MSEEKLLTVRDVAVFLGVSEKDVLDLADNGTIPAYKVGGVYLRFKREQVEDFKKKSRMVSSQDRAMKDYTVLDRLRDFLYFNDFYIFAIVLIFAMLFFIFRG